MWPTLKRRTQFELVYRLGRKRTSPHFVVFHLEHAEARVGYVASRRVGGAVQRNRAKRLLRAAFRAVAADAEVGWIVLVARSAIVHRRSPELAQELETVLAGLRGESVRAPGASG